jgi:serine/threonine protein phosphatase PrpC
VTPVGLNTRTIRLQVAGRTDVGQRRKENQDSFLIVDLTRSEAGGALLEPDLMTGAPVTAEFDLGEKGALCLVADGMGGHAAGGVAASLAVASIHDELRKHWSADRDSSAQQFARRLKQAVEASNQRIHEVGSADPRLRGMGTTTTAVGVLDGGLYVAQVGDSRAYLVRNGVANLITRDQSYIQNLVDAGTITEEEAERSQHRNMILQAVGTAPFVDVDLTYQKVRRGDLLLVCSDGLTKVMNSKDFAEICLNRDPAGLCDQLVDLANLRGGPDNITVVVALLDGTGLDEPVDGERVARQAYTLES